MTNANEMAQKGFDTGFTDANDNELHVGDYVRICGHIGKIVFSCGAFGIFITDEVPWDALEELVRKDSGNHPSFLYNDNFISFWEIVWNLSEDTDEPCLPYVESLTATGGVFTDEKGDKDVFMGCINGCSATLTQCEYTCGHYHTCDTVAVANDLLRDEELGKEGNDKKYLFPESNVIDMSKLYKDGEDVMFYWCNACGEVNLPGDIGIVLHKEDELPLHIQSIYANLECECNETNEYAANICNKSGILLMALYPYQFVADVLKIDERSQKAQDATEQFALNLKAFSNDLLAEFKKIDPNCEVVLGIHTDPEGPELGVFIPFFEDEKPVENNLSAVRKRFNEIAYSDAVRNLIRKGVNSNG